MLFFMPFAMSVVKLLLKLHRLSLNDLCTGAARWQAVAFNLGTVMTVAGLLVMLLTALRSFGAAELLGQVALRTSDACCGLLIF